MTEATTTFGCQAPPPPQRFHLGSEGLKGWLPARQLRGDKGRWIVRADAAEVERLRQLRAFEVAHHGRRTPPPELTTPPERTPC
jgi:hypothetical protein